MTEFEGHVALLTGAGSGIGAATARLLARSGAAVLVTDIDGDRAAAVAADIEGDGGTASSLALDIYDLDAAENAVATAVARYGQLDHAVNNAGITGDYGPIIDSDPTTWARVVDVNVVGTYYNLRSQLRHLIARGSGSIVNTASITAVNGQAFTSAYNSSKHAIAGLTKTAALESATSGVRVNAVAPGYVRTPLLDSVFTDQDWDNVALQHPMERVATPIEVAELIIFLLSDRASFITGSIHLVDGGFSAR